MSNQSTKVKGERKMTPSPPSRRSLPATSKNIVIIGAGIVGAMTAYFLASDGHQVTVFEKGTPAFGSSSRSAACIRQQFGSPENIIATRFSTDFYERFPRIMGTNKPIVTQNGYLYPHHDPEQFEKAKRAFLLQRRLGLAEVELFESQAAILKRFPELIPDGLIGGTFCPTDGFIKPTNAVNDTMSRAKKLDVRLLNWTEVVGTDIQSGKIIAIHGQRKGNGGIITIHPDIVINAAGPWAPNVAINILGTSILVKPWKRYLTFLKGRGNAIDEATFARRPMYVFQNGLYGHPEGRERFLLGWAKKPDKPSPIDFADDYQDEIGQGFLHKEGNDSYPYDMWREMAKRVIFIGGMKGIHATTCGLYSRTPDDKQIVSWDSAVENLIHAVGFSGRGIMCGPFTGEMIRQLITQGRDCQTITVLIRGKLFEVSTGHFALERQYIPEEMKSI